MRCANDGDDVHGSGLSRFSVRNAAVVPQVSATHWFSAHLDHQPGRSRRPQHLGGPNAVPRS